MFSLKLKIIFLVIHRINYPFLPCSTSSLRDLSIESSAEATFTNQKTKAIEVIKPIIRKYSITQYPYLVLFLAFHNNLKVLFYYLANLAPLDLSMLDSRN